MAPYARTEVIVIAVLGLAVAALLGWYAPLWCWIPVVVAAALLSFYRDPRRAIPAGVDLLLAPADGKIVAIDRQVDRGHGAGPELRIMIFLSVFNVHINRSPCAGRVIDVRYKPGEFLNALDPAADLRNEANTIVVAPATPLPGPVHVRQIAGVLARRIVCAVKTSDILEAGQRVGMIKLGSRTEICVPEDPRWIVDVALGQHVKGGMTVLARLGGGERR